MCKQIFDESLHAEDTFSDSSQVVTRPVVKFVAVVFGQGLRETSDPAQRSFEIMRDSVGEGLQLSVGIGQLRRPLLNAVFQLRQELALLPVGLLECFELPA